MSDNKYVSAIIALFSFQVMRWYKFFQVPETLKKVSKKTLFTKMPVNKNGKILIISLKEFLRA
ncbi:hypothetical protein C4M81_04105 [Mycoplasmopsis pullorum]|nr:hypothetical protein C4M94_04090 [Mycoplasmopsis pullorum]TNK82914.1 hypothetical protein C4M81_04105 [Mycoplasmopsis pullorum]